MKPTGILFGTHIHPAEGNAARRQEYAMDRLLELALTTPINLQFGDLRNIRTKAGFETVSRLRQDSCTITGKDGVRKPLVNELFSQLATLALERGLGYFCFTNSDIIFTENALQVTQVADKDAYIFARSDFDNATRVNTIPLVYGTDAFVIDAKWWLNHAKRFRSYVVGECCWDNIYTAQLLCWANGLLLNRDALVLHEMHPIAWANSPFAEHNRYLAGLDRIYFSRWALYVERLELIRRHASGLALLDDEISLQNSVFARWRPSLLARSVQLLRFLKLKAERRRRS